MLAGPSSSPLSSVFSDIQNSDVRLIHPWYNNTMNLVAMPTSSDRMPAGRTEPYKSDIIENSCAEFPLEREA